MPAINFSMFVDKLEQGDKTCTIRNNKPRGAKIGKPCKLYTGMRTKKCRLINEVTITNIIQLKISRYPILQILDNENNKVLNSETIIKNDGFESEADFIKYHFRDYPLELESIYKHLIEFTPANLPLNLN